MSERTSSSGRPGIPVDSFGGATIDPTKNVLDLVEAANKRQDDLRQADIRRLEEALETFKRCLSELMAAHDKRYEQRYEAQIKALDAAFVAQKDAVTTAMIAQKEANSAGLAAQKEAVTKAETAAEKRFEATDKARLEQAEQLRAVMPRAEVAVIERGLDEKIGQLTKQVDELKSQRNVQMSERRGVSQGWGYAVGVAGFVLAMLAIVAAVAAFIARQA